ncbi:iron ABC transporter substrate-binding protein [Candidatus Mycoplasma haematohominis]|uniref:iron ABC transporter substrate-binding protein n=1 Tax=Candidatus Mycoplasma haematohominis TaxID=1494318 RepID=UPI001C0A6C2B|nr:iron ABC transporter substrate-binding protein [Candidatus Mycoplasma haemohominis]
MYLQGKTFNYKLVLPLLLVTGTVSSSFFGGRRSYKIITNYNSQADLLLSLGISPDYYPYQLRKSKPFDYLSNVDKYLVVNNNVSDNKKKLSRNLQAKLDSLFSKIQEFGDGLWDKTIYDAGLSHRNNEFWNQKQTSLLLLEQFVVDDYPQISDAYDILPSHKHLIITNHRASRDPFTVFGESVFNCFKASQTEKCDSVAKSFKQYVKNYDKVHVNSIYRFGRYIDFWNQFDTDDSEPSFKEWLDSEDLFNSDSHLDHEIAHRYAEAIFAEEELDLLSEWEGKSWTINYLNHSPTLVHHAALEEQTMPGSTPMAEGSQRESMLFLYQTAFLIDKFTKSDSFEEAFASDSRKDAMKNAMKNAAEIGKEIKERFKNIREYFKKIGVVDNNFCPESNKRIDTNSKRFGIVVFPPDSFGNGDSMMQTISRYPFLYKDIGLRQAIPDTLLKHEHNEEHDHESEEELFAVDDHGWWWNLGNINLGNSKISEFKDTVDNLIVLANEDDWKLLENSASIRGISHLLKNSSALVNDSYDLWSEGLKNPIALNLILDSLVNMFQKEYDKDFSHKSEYQKAMEWGNYWSETYLKI